MITGIGHIAITATDFEKSISFYRDTLGLPEAFRVNREDGAPWMAYVKTGANDFIEIFDGKGVAGEDTPEIGVKHVCLWVDDIEQTLSDLKNRGMDVDPQGAKTGKSRCRQYFVQDPDGVRIELMQLMPDSLQAKALL